MENEQHWEIVDEETKEHWLSLRDPEGWYEASAKWDGCVHLYRYYNVPVTERKKGDDPGHDYYHICDIDYEIRRLQSLKEMAKEFFKKDHYYKKSWGKD